MKPLDPLHAITFTQDRAVIRAGDRGVRRTCRRLHAAHRVRAQFHEPRPEDGRGNARAGRVCGAAGARAAPGRAAAGRKALILVSEGFRPAQPRAIVYAANRNGVAIYPIDPHPEAGRRRIDAADRSPSKPAARQASTTRIWRLRSRRPSPISITISSSAFRHQDRPTADFIRCRCASSARARRHDRGRATGHPTPSVAALAAKAAAARTALPFRPSHSSPYIRPWIGMSRGPDGLTSVTVTWESGATAAAQSARGVDSREGDRERRDGAVRESDGAGDVDRATFDAPPGYVALEMAIQSSSGAALDTDYRGIVGTEPSGDEADVRNAAGVADADGARFRRGEPERRCRARGVARSSAAPSGCCTRSGLRHRRRAHPGRHRAPAQPARHSDAHRSQVVAARCRRASSSSTSRSRRSHPTSTASSWSRPTRPGPGTKPRKWCPSALPTEPGYPAPAHSLLMLEN